MSPILETTLGKLYEADCLRFLAQIESSTVDLVFADPPFNLGKKYSSGIDDAKDDTLYLKWCEEWLAECTRVLAPGGALFLWNLPKWNLPLGGFLSRNLTFRHWISVDIKYSLPISGRLYPAHYSLLYFIKGSRPAIFHPDRVPITCCRHCGGELKDYGGYKNKMNPSGVNLSDVWSDIPPVRHAKYKKREANALSLKLMDRVVSMASDPGSLVIDPFGGSGTTFIAAELLGRSWAGCDLDCAPIQQRFADLHLDREHIEQIQRDKNVLFRSADLKTRQKSGLKLSRDYRFGDSQEVKDCSCERQARLTGL